MIDTGTTGQKNGIAVIIGIIVNTIATIIAIGDRVRSTIIESTIADTNGTGMATTGISKVTEITIVIIAAIMAIRQNTIIANITVLAITMVIIRAIGISTMASVLAFRSGSRAWPSA